MVPALLGSDIFSYCIITGTVYTVLYAIVIVVIVDTMIISIVVSLRYDMIHNIIVDYTGLGILYSEWRTLCSIHELCIGDTI